MNKSILNFHGNCNTILLINTLSFFLSLSAADDANEYFCGELVSVLDSAYKQAPPRVHYIVDSLNNKMGKHRYPFNYTIFNGKPGVGKSTLAVAMAHKLQWEVQKFSSRDFTRTEYRNGTAAAFNNTMSQFEECDENTIIILEEINHLLMNYDSKHHDTDTSSMSLWTFLDKIKCNNHLFLIGTTNSIGGFPPQLRSRFKASIITIPTYTDFQHLKNHFLECLNMESMALSKESMQYINDNTDQFATYSTRDLILLIEMLRFKVIELTPELYHTEILTIQPQHINAALQELEDVELQYEEKPYKETEFDQRERHHQEALSQSAKQFYISTLVNSILSIGGLITGTCVNIAQHTHTSQQQQTFHDQAMQQQATNHEEAMNLQKMLMVFGRAYVAYNWLFPSKGPS